MDRRHAPRITRRMQAHIGSEDARLPAVTRDASVTGVLLTSEAADGSLEIGQRVTLSIEMGDEVHLVSGRVVRCDPHATVQLLIAIELDAPARWALSLAA